MLDLARDVANAPRGIDALAAVLRYFFVVTNADPTPVGALLATQLNEATTEAVMTTAAERWMEQGEARGKANLVLRQLTLKFGPQSDAVVAHVRSASPTDLDHYADRILTATSIDDVLAPLKP
jgi:hypothetical protein